jgi:hypothetical protein
MTIIYASTEYFQNVYLGVTKDPHTAREILHYAKKMLGKAKIVQNLESAITISQAMNLTRGQPDIDLHMGLFRSLSQFHEYIIDEVAIVSAFELYAKATLLKKQYLIHEITRPAHLRTKQKKTPIHRATFRASYRKGENPQVDFKTLGTGKLLSAKYKKCIGLPSYVFTEIASFNKDRNLVHLHAIQIYGMSEKKLRGIKALKKNIDAAV